MRGGGTPGPALTMTLATGCSTPPSGESAPEARAKTAATDTPVELVIRVP